MLIGGLGRDTLIGGAGADTFVFNSAAESPTGLQRDVVQDFQAGVDRLDFSGFGGLEFIGRQGFSGTAGELHYVRGSGITLVEADLNGDAVADFQIELTGSMRLSSADFLL